MNWKKVNGSNSSRYTSSIQRCIWDGCRELAPHKCMDFGSWLSEIKTIGTLLTLSSLCMGRFCSLRMKDRDIKSRQSCTQTYLGQSCNIRNYMQVLGCFNFLKQRSFFFLSTNAWRLLFSRPVQCWTASKLLLQGFNLDFNWSWLYDGHKILRHTINTYRSGL